MRLIRYGSPENDIAHRFYIPLSHFETYAKDMEEYIFKKSLSIYDEENTDEDEYENEYEDELEEDEDYREFDNGTMYFLSDRHRYSIQFPNILRSSLLISVYAFFENQLTRLCKEIQIKKQLPVKFKSINGKGIERAKTYLSDVVQLNFPSDSKEWNLISDYQNIRNCFAHSEGIVTKDDNKVMKSVQKLKALGVNGDDFLGKSIYLHKEFIFNFIKVINSFWRMIEDQYLEILYPAFYWYRK
ncbi:MULTISPECIES: hypothetical protein [unclassified Priestia]|uniref:hypothetical protein n=1 Tax=unclassified Priestia TaxID=2800374 RepID=UPI00367073BE